LKLGPLKLGPLKLGPLKLGPLKPGPLKLGPLKPGPLKPGPLKPELLKPGHQGTIHNDCGSIEFLVFVLDAGYGQASLATSHATASIMLLTREKQSYRDRCLNKQNSKLP
jgi:hypothetical protein